MSGEMARGVSPLSISEEMIHRLVHGFYAKVRADTALGPIFERVIGENWDAHLAKMCDFWSSVMLTSGRYHGNPMVAHMRQKSIQPAHFERWLALFRITAQELFEPAIALAFIARAETIARSLQLGMFFRPENQNRQAAQ
ncbi:MAG TPA: group III truncated hemoglobin [Rhizomicrobium sp.]|nr:group III truncated hemoglobin [Rhizomicrobium sp.]